MNTPEYNLALELTKQYLDNPIGYSNYEAVGAADKQVIRQNNVIICLLEQLMQKLKGAPVEKDINDLINKIDKLNIGPPPTKKPPNKSKGMYTFGYK